MFVARPTLALARRAVRTTTDALYHRALGLMLAWCRDHSVRLAVPSDWDAALACYMEHQYANGKGKAAGASVLSAVVHFHPELRDCLHRSRRTLKGWTNSAPSVSHPPITWQLTCGLAVKAASAGRTASALAFLLAHDCYLRRSEVAGLRAAHLQPDPVTGDLLVVLPRSKTGRNQSVLVRNLLVVRALRAVAADKRPSDHLFPSGRTLYADFVAACRALGVADHGFTFHSLRHGGATEDYLRGGEPALPAIQVRGRWRQVSSLQVYLHGARAVLAQRALDGRLLRYCAAIDQNQQRVLGRSLGVL